MKEFLGSWVNHLMDHSMLQRLLMAFVILVVAKVLLVVLRRAIDHAENKGFDKAAKPLIYSLFSYCIYIVTLLLILHVLGVNTAGLVAMVGAASLAIGLALKDTLSNIASGLLLLFLRPFKAGDYIECGSIKGNIIGIGLFNTTFKTVDGLFVSAPNSALWGQPIVNFSNVAGEPLFLLKPEPQFFVSSLEDSSVNVTFRAWARTQDYFNLRWKYTAEIKKRFAEENITIPFPQRTVHVVDKA